MVQRLGHCTLWESRILRMQNKSKLYCHCLGFLLKLLDSSGRTFCPRVRVDGNLKSSISTIPNFIISVLWMNLFLSYFIKNESIRFGIILFICNSNLICGHWYTLTFIPFIYNNSKKKLIIWKHKCFMKLNNLCLQLYIYPLFLTVTLSQKA